MRSVKAFTNLSVSVRIFSHAHSGASSRYWRAVSERMAQTDQTGQKPRCVRRARKNVIAHVLVGNQERTALTEQMDGGACA